MQLSLLMTMMFGRTFPSMLVASATGGVTSFSTPMMFNNLVRRADSWTLQSGVPSGISRYGVLTADSPLDEWSLKIADTNTGAVPAQGVYHVSWEGDGEVAVGGFSTPESFHTWTTLKDFTFTYNSSVVLSVWFRGVTITSLSVCHESKVADYIAGNEFDIDYINYLKSLHLPVLRQMDLNNASFNKEVEWSDRPDINTCITFGLSIPLEPQIELIDRVGCDLYYNIPVRASDAYIIELGTQMEAQLPVGRKVYFELGNETWNPNSYYHAGMMWVTYLDAPAIEAATDKVNVSFISPNHGLTTGDVISCYTSIKQELKGKMFDGGQWEMSFGNTLTVTVIDANTFSLDTITSIHSNQDVLLYKRTDVGIVNRDINYVRRSEQIWDLLELNLPSSKSKYIIASQSANMGVTQARYNAITDTARVHSMSVAPYYAASLSSYKLTLATGSVTPSVYMRNSGSTMYFGLYLSSDTPTQKEIIEGVGSINSQTLPFVIRDGTYQGGATVTALTDGENYTAYFVIKDDLGVQKTMSSTFVLASPFTEVVGFESLTDFADREMSKILESVDQIHDNGGLMTLDYSCYEGGPHYFGDIPAELNTWLFDVYLPSNENQSNCEQYIRELAARGCLLYCQFTAHGSTIFSLTQDIANPTLDGRYRAFESFNGLARIPANPPPTITGGAISGIAEPSTPTGTFYELSQLVTSILPVTYSIFSGNDDGMFTVNTTTGELSISDGKTFPWGVVDLYPIGIRIDDGYSVAQTMVSLEIAPPPELKLSLNGIDSYLEINLPQINSGDTIEFEVSTTDMDAYLVVASGGNYYGESRWLEGQTKPSDVLMEIDGVPYGFGADITEFLNGSPFILRTEITSGSAITTTKLLIGRRSSSNDALSYYSGTVKNIIYRRGASFTRWAMDSNSTTVESPVQDDLGAGDIILHNVAPDDWSLV